MVVPNLVQRRTISNIWNTTVATKMISNGIMTASNVLRIFFFDLKVDAVTSSLDARRVTKRTAIKAPPTPALITGVLEAAVAVAIAKLIFIV